MWQQQAVRRWKWFGEGSRLDLKSGGRGITVQGSGTTGAATRTESCFSENFQRHMETFLSYLRFWQDVLVHCTSADVRLTLIDHFQILFLQQLL